MSRVLVTGGAGFIGSHLVEALISQGAQVRVLDNLSSGRLDNLAGLEIELIVGDIRDRDQVLGAARGVELIYHLAAMVGVPDSVRDPVGSYAANLIGSLHILEAAREHKVRKVVLASSAAVYGAREGRVDETSPTAPLSPYGASKLAMEQAAAVYAGLYGVACVCLRYFNAYGPRQGVDSPYAAVIPTFIRSLLSGAAPAIEGDGGQTRDFVYVGDVVQANLLAARSAVANGQALNVASGYSASILSLAGLLTELAPVDGELSFGPPRAGDIRHSSAEVSRAAQALGYRSQTALKEGLRATVEWFRRVMPAAPS